MIQHKLPLSALVSALLFSPLTFQAQTSSLENVTTKASLDLSVLTDTNATSESIFSFLDSITSNGKSLFIKESLPIEDSNKELKVNRYWTPNLILKNEKIRKKELKPYEPPFEFQSFAMTNEIGIYIIPNLPPHHTNYIHIGVLRAPNSQETAFNLTVGLAHDFSKTNIPSPGIDIIIARTTNSITSYSVSETNIKTRTAFATPPRVIGTTITNQYLLDQIIKYCATNSPLLTTFPASDSVQ